MATYCPFGPRNEIYCTKLQPPPESLTRGLPSPDPLSLCPLFSTEYVEPPSHRTKFLGTPLLLSYPTYDIRLTCVVNLHLICGQILIMNRDKYVCCLSTSMKLWYETGNAHITCNIEARSRNHCCRDKTISITYSECVFARAVLFSWGSCADATSWG